MLLYGAFSVRLKLQLMEEPESAGPVGTERPPPQLVLESLDGQETDLAVVAGENRVTLVNFWATWCGPCKLEMPQFQRMYEERGGRGLEILAVTTEEEDVVREFIQEKGYTFPILLDPGGVVTERYGVEAFPTTVLVGPTGKVTRHWTGLNPSLEREINGALGPIPEAGGDGPNG